MSINRKSPLYPQAVDEATIAYLAIKDEASHKEIVKAIIRAYAEVAEDLESKRIDGRISDTTRRIAQMEVGNIIHVPPQPTQSIRQRFPLARRLGNIPNAQWQTKILTTGKVEIRRIEDDGKIHSRDPLSNPKVKELVSLRVGEEILSKTIETTRSKGQMGSNTKIQARKYLNNSSADWTVRQGSRGVILKRIR